MSRGLDLSTQRDAAVERTIARGDVLLAVGDGRFLSRTIDRDDLLIGRDPGCDFAIDHRSLSRRHARLRVASRPPTVQDLGSTNGTLIGGRLVHGGAPMALLPQGAFEIGPFSFIVVARGPSSLASLSGRPLLAISDPTPRGLPPVVHDFARSSTSILITGETGVGKEILAATLHALSGRPGPLIQINCAALTESLLENELFGHERGAFTGAASRSEGLIEAAAGGTLLLDEIGEMPLTTQAKLLRVVERREVLRLGATRPIKIDVRFLAATNRDLRVEVAQRRFREDLFYRLDGLTLQVLPLRERRGMIAPLALELLGHVRGGGQVELSAEVVRALEQHRWPGNVRELKAVIERAAVLARTGAITVRHLLLDRAAPTTGAPVDALDPEAEADRARIVRALEECAGNQSRAAKLLGMSRTALVTRLRIYKIARPTRR